MKKEVLVLGVKKYDFITEDGEKVQGTRVYFYDEEGDESSKEKVKGYIPTKRWFPGFEKFEQFQSNNLPGKYEMEYDIRISEKGLNLVIKGFTYVGSAEPIA
ncbi:hypothetical protein [Bacillus sinesaloumensis]|uniref:hypothetical protein n=1 Tax=Litchfieldia sinesaloumensis TaxID=1926280 RepID=UPI0009887ED8|nr:hypothetical protein [Bacillus sinesaloumensis]